MPRVRCKFYEEDGTPVNGGCRKIGFCDFIHPSDPLWANAPAPKSRTTTQHIGGDGGGGKNFNKRRESGSGWQQSSEQGGPPATGTNSWGNPGTGWGSRAGGNGGGGRKASKEGLSTWRNSTADSSSTENTWGNVSWADPSAADSSSWENFSWGNPAASTSKSSAWESSEKGKEVDRSGNSGWDNAGAWGDSPWGNGGSGWGDTTVTSGWGSWGDTSATPGWGTGDSSAAADREEPEPPTANPGTPTEPKAMRERTRISSPDKEGWGTFQEPRATTEEAMDSDTPSNAQPGNESWGSSNTTVKGESSVPTPADSAQSTAWAIAALASEPSPAARLEREDGEMDSESPATGNANGEAMEVDDWEPQVKSHLSPSPPPPPPADVHRPNTPPTQTPVSSSSLTRKRARSPSEPKDSEAYTRSDYVKALIESTLCQYQYDQAQALQAKDKALRHSKAYHNAGPRAIERLTQLGAEHAAEHAQAQKRRNAAAKRLVSISEYYHDSSTLPLDWVHAEDADPVEFVSRSIEDVKAWVNKAAELVKVPAALSGVQHPLDSSSSVYSTATAAVTLGLTSRLAKMEKRVEDQYSYLSQLQEDSEQMLDQSLEERWTFMSSVHTKTKEHLRTCRESKANINAELMKLNQDMVVVKEMHRHLAEERAQVLKEHHCLDTRIVELEQNDIIRNEVMRRNTEEIERIKAGFREAEEARKRAPDPVDPTIIADLLRPTVEQIVHKEIENISSTLVDGVSSSLAVYQKQTAEAVWTHLHPILRLNSEIHKIANEHRSRVPETRAAVFDVEPQALR